MPEYFIRYSKAFQCGGKMIKDEKYVFIKARSGAKAWVKCTMQESNFNGIRLLDIRRL